ncbi:Glycosyl transferase, group 1 [Rhodopseudomonas palustris HaA2]|uniref:Glycosyl transferase, group 1 n=1 Tax=Rhodopseudomonas palustris (strain HaA2) TaxID=316058 RepID=Q2IZV0_RHOP2|nr:glycosyltransferase family 4 protein [Rhodopseudomonas palustris]ABD06260.1 Glycosyl transferase, group 1 [Rhodopseudomonas palustris HaA2]
MPVKKRLMFVVTEDWYFVSHRLPLARAARDAGYDVLVATRLGDHAELIAREGITPIGLRSMRRGGRNPIGELAAIAELAALYRQYKPDIVHHIAIKPVLYGSIAARMAGVRGVVNNLAGLGFVFSSKTRKAALLRPAIRALLAIALKRRGTLTIVQNSDDANVLATNIGIPADRIRLIKGSGVDMQLFAEQRAESSPPIVILASRMIWDKGIGDFVKAASLLKADGVAARFVVLGAPDPGNPGSIPQSVLEGLNNEGIVEWWGHRSDMPAIIAGAALVCLPTTYGEGVPKILIEAAAGGCAIVAYDVAGCREIVTDGDNGKLVPAGDIGQLAAAIKVLLEDPDRRAAMGSRGRKRVETEFALEHVVAQTLSVYRGLEPT